MQRESVLHYCQILMPKFLDAFFCFSFNINKNEKIGNYFLCESIFYACLFSKNYLHYIIFFQLQNQYFSSEMAQNSGIICTLFVFLLIWKESKTSFSLSS